MNESKSLREKAKNLRGAAGKLEDAADILDGLGLTGSAQPSRNNQTVNESSFRKDTHRAGVGRLTGRNLILSILIKLGEPMSKKEIFVEMKKRGARLASEGTLATYLSRDDRFVSKGDGKWGLAEWKETFELDSKEDAKEIL